MSCSENDKECAKNFEAGFSEAIEVLKLLLVNGLMNDLDRKFLIKNMEESKRIAMKARYKKDEG